MMHGQKNIKLSCSVVNGYQILTRTSCLLPVSWRWRPQILNVRTITLSFTIFRQKRTSSEDGDSGLLGYDAMSTGKQLRTFRLVPLPPLPGVRNFKCIWHRAKSQKT